MRFTFVWPEGDHLTDTALAGLVGQSCDITQPGTATAVRGDVVRAERGTDGHVKLTMEVTQ